VAWWIAMEPRSGAGQRSSCGFTAIDRFGRIYDSAVEWRSVE
jgi:hypothetical protein